MLDFFVFLCTILHECGHIVAARCVGLRVFGIEIGHGRSVADFRFAGLRWQFRALPYGGRAYAAPSNVAFYRLRQTVFILGGPLVNAALVAATIRGTFGGEKVLYEMLSQQPAPIASLFAANAALFLYSLCPYEITTPCGKIPNDALSLWRTWRMPKAAIGQTRLAWYFYEIERCRQERNFGEAETLVKAGLERYPDNLTLLTERALLCDEQGDFRAALEISEALLARSNELPCYRPIFLNNVAYFALCTRNADLLERADLLSREAIKQMPWLASIQGTRGGVLLRLGCYEEALKLLHAAITTHDDRTSRAISACWLAEAYHSINEPGQAKHYLAIARRADPHCALLQSVGQAITNSPSVAAKQQTSCQ